ncbi:MAG: carbamoyl-phosphate synthase large subunit [Oligoflexia bacterium]|nr:carbamoyl-phosphate synthase large subunit [Oligoflexia bacterium]
MSKREDIKKIMLLGSGPIVIGQACEFDYSGTQACKALRSEGYEVILVNSNPATIMTDPETADKVYIEPLEVSYLEKIIEKEKPDAIIPTLGGQTALNCAISLHEAGVLQKYNVELLGANVESIKKAEDREIFKNLMAQIGAKVPKSITVKTLEQGKLAAEEIGFPIILRPSFTLGGSGGGIAYSLEEYLNILEHGLSESPTSEVLVEQSVLGWKEFELEVMRDKRGTFVVICSIENFDPMGVHTGDSITIAPIMTLTDKAYQEMRDEARKVIEVIGVETGGANIQFAVNPQNGERIVIEMNPRVSRSSALASKATGFPIAKIAAKLAVGYELDEILNDITKTTPSCFEPSLDYVVTKIPRFNFEKFPGVKDHLTTQMKSIGEVMGIGRTFKESFMKAMSSLEKGTGGLDSVTYSEAKLSSANSQRIYHIAQALREGVSVEKIHELTQITPWFLEQLKEIIEAEKSVNSNSVLNYDHLYKYKKLGLTDSRLSVLSGISTEQIRNFRKNNKIQPGFWVVDTCSGEFASETPYYYSSYHKKPNDQFKLKDPVVILGSGPNRIGQAIEFDYGCVRAIKGLKENNVNAIMINSNPETVSTDYDTSDALFFEPLTEEHVLEVLNYVNPKGVCVQFGGQTPIQLAPTIINEGYKILGSSLQTIELAEDRELFAKLCTKLGLKIPQHQTVLNVTEALRAAEKIGYPIICRPSFVLGGRKMEIVGSTEELQDYFRRNPDVVSATSPLFIDHFLENALEVDVDLISDGETVFIGGIIEHIEGAGVHSGDSMGVLPPQRIAAVKIDEIEKLSRQLCLSLKIIGHLNLQLAIKDGDVYVLEANPRSSRSVPFIAKATGIPLVKLAVRCILGQKLHVTHSWRQTKSISVKGVVFPFKKFREADILLGPEMRSTGESMGRSTQDGINPPEYVEALEKAFVSSGYKIPQTGKVFFSIKDKDKDESLELAKVLEAEGYEIIATKGTAEYFDSNGLKVKSVKKVREGSPHCVDMILSGDIKAIVNTTSGSKSVSDSFSIRRGSLEKNIPCLTEISAAKAFVKVLLKSQRTNKNIRVNPL